MLRYGFCGRLQVYPLHSTITLEEQNGVFLKPVHGFRKVKISFAFHNFFSRIKCSGQIFNVIFGTGLKSDQTSSHPPVTLLLSGDSFHQHSREFSDCSGCQIWWEL